MSKNEKNAALKKDCKNTKISLTNKSFRKNISEVEIIWI